MKTHNIVLRSITLVSCALYLIMPLAGKAQHPSELGPLAEKDEVKNFINVYNNIVTQRQYDEATTLTLKFISENKNSPVARIAGGYYLVCSLMNESVFLEDHKKRQQKIEQALEYLFKVEKYINEQPIIEQDRLYKRLKQNELPLLKSRILVDMEKESFQKEGFDLGKAIIDKEPDSHDAIAAMVCVNIYLDKHQEECEQELISLFEKYPGTLAAERVLHSLALHYYRKKDIRNIEKIKERMLSDYKDSIYLETIISFSDRLKESGQKKEE